MKRILVTVSLLFLFIGFAFGNLGFWLSAPASEPIKADLIVALGGDSGERGEVAAILYKAGYAKMILLTGMESGSEAIQVHYLHWRSQFLLEQGVPAEALIFDNQAANTHQEAISIATLLQTHHWQSVLVVSDPPHLRRLNYSLDPVFRKAGLHYRLIQSKASTWHPEGWWQSEKWAQFCVMEVVKLVYYAFAYPPI
ncbi:MAG: hypothetical protein CTY16_03060 [Methylobacter sp.]|nr:MAG: hypothetical protein CTY16_03060 [Methylobacter sp.]